MKGITGIISRIAVPLNRYKRTNISNPLLCVYSEGSAIIQALELLYQNVLISEVFTRNNCNEGYFGSEVEYIIPAGTYQSGISQVVANSKAQYDIDLHGQDYANVNGICLLIYQNVFMSDMFNRNNCNENYIGSEVEYIVPAGTYQSVISQVDANSKAQDDIDLNGQEYANINGTCLGFAGINVSGENSGEAGRISNVKFDDVDLVPYTGSFPVPLGVYPVFSRYMDLGIRNIMVYFYNGLVRNYSIRLFKEQELLEEILIVEDTGTVLFENILISVEGSYQIVLHGTVFFQNVLMSDIFIRNNCNQGYYGTEVEYIVPAGTYQSVISQADANIQAQDDIDLNGQDYANVNGSCLLDSLLLKFDDIANADLLVGDSSDVADWNTFFYPSNGTQFTSVVVVGNVVSLRGGSGIKLRDSLFSNNLHILEIEDSLGCILEIGNYCFYNCTGLVKCVFPALITIYQVAFAGCIGLVETSFPVLTSISSNGFSGCTGLVNPSFPALIGAGNDCFLNCTGLVNPSFPVLEHANIQCFMNCSGLVNPSFPALLLIAVECFVNCIGIISLSIPVCTALGTSVGDNAVFDNISGKEIILTVPVALMTCNGGNPDGDITYLQANNTVTIIQV